MYRQTGGNVVRVGIFAFLFRPPLGSMFSVEPPTSQNHRPPAAQAFARPNFPKRRARVGSTSRLSAVEVARPPRITSAIGPSISQPASPLFKADKITKPLLIGQGANDPRVNVKESEQIVEAIEKNKGSVTYGLYPDEGHGFARPENRIDFNARTEMFLAKYLGGRSEPLEGEKVPGSTAVVKVVGGK